MGGGDYDLAPYSKENMAPSNGYEGLVDVETDADAMEDAIQTPYWEEDSRHYSTAVHAEERGRQLARDAQDDLAVGTLTKAVLDEQQPSRGSAPLKRSNSVGSHSRRAMTPSQSGYDLTRLSAYRRGSVDDSVISDTRAYRIAQTEAAIRSEMFKECTFKPRVRPLPKNVYPEIDSSKIDMVPFYSRVSEWQKGREDKLMSKKIGYEEARDQEMTFKPRMNRNSERAVLELRGPAVAAEDVHERLYRHYELALTERSEFINQEVMRARMENDMECTFHPKTGADSARFADIEPRYDRPTTAQRLKQKKRIDNRHPYQNTDPYAYITPEAILGQTSEMKECTFTPKVKGVSNNMASAKLYVSSNVVDRLTRPSAGNTHTSTSGDSGNFDVTYGADRNVIDINSFMGNLGGIPGMLGHSNDYSNVRQSYPSDRSRDGISMGSAPTLTAEEREARRQAFSKFMGRQEQSEARRERHVEEMIRASKPTFTPTLCRKSIDISEQCFSGNFLERVERNTIKREDQMQRREMSFIGEKEATFKPSLTKKSEKMRARSSFEMSKGDVLRKEASKKMLEARLTEENKKDMTFKPKITQKAREEASSFLKLGEDTSYHLDRYQETLMRQKLMREYEHQRREDAETEGCTFTPTLKECPSYVKRIARSVATIKSSQNERVKKVRTAEERRIEREQNWNSSCKVQD
jgi:hypothetical protein